jgi:phenylpyruvate tautomerase PptA (4-oxalocrotonate tautomerase family)
VPIYQCHVPAGSLTAQTRAAVAEAITDVHSTVTKAPRGFVRVIFVEYGHNVYFTAGQPDDGALILGNIRAGLDRAARAELLEKLSNAWASTTGQDLRELVIGLSDIDPTSAMEAGIIMPARGEEAQWLEHHRDHLAQIVTGQ